MELTLTVEELRAHDAKLRDWGHQRGVFIEQRLLELYDSRAMSFQPRGHAGTMLAAAIADWEAKNPVPSLIPAV